MVLFIHLLDIGACEVVLKTKTKENFERRLRAEHSMLYINLICLPLHCTVCFSFAIGKFTFKCKRIFVEEIK